jgi:hypothetical protein
MFERLKANFKASTAVVEVGHSFDYISQKLLEVDNRNDKEAITIILYLYYYFHKEIVNKCDDYNISPTVKLFTLSGRKTIAVLMSETLYELGRLIIINNLQSKADEIDEKRNIYFELEKLHRMK